MTVGILPETLSEHRSSREGGSVSLGVEELRDHCGIPSRENRCAGHITGDKELEVL